MGYFVGNIISGIQLFYICSNVPVDIIRVFLISDFLAESLKSKKDHSFYNTVLLKKFSLILRISTRLALGITSSRHTAKNLSEFRNFLTLQSLHISFCCVKKQQQQQQQQQQTKNKIKQKIFALHHFWMPRTAFLSVYFCIPLCLYISVRKFLFQRRSKILFGGDGFGRNWIIYLRRLTV